MARYAFMLSTGRTGTQFFGTVLNRSEDVVAYHEPKPDMGWEGRNYVRWRNGAFRRFTYRNYLPYPLYYRAKLSLSRTLKPPYRSSNLYFEANGNLSCLLPELKRCFPNCTIILVIRDPRGFVRSGLNRGWFLYKDKRKRINAIYADQMSEEEWSNKTPLERLNWYYLYRNRIVLEEHPDLILTHKSIFDQNHRGFDRVLDLLDIDDIESEGLFDEKINPSFDLVPPYAEWDTEWKEQIQRSVNWYDKFVEEGHVDLSPAPLPETGYE